MNIKQFLYKCALVGVLTLIPYTVHGAKIESVKLEAENGRITVEGVSSTAKAVIEVKKDDTTEYLSLIENVGEDGKFIHSLKLNNAQGFYVIRLNDGINSQKPDEREVYFEKNLSADKIKTNIKGRDVKIGDKITATAIVSNTSEINADTRIFAAMYDSDGNLIGVKSFKKMVDGENTDCTEISFNVPAQPGLKKIKLMLWGEEQPPYAKKVEYDVEDCFEIYVSLDGNDYNIGTEESPFKTIERALEKADEYGGNAVIYLRDGRYMIDTLNLNSNESGVVIAGYPGETAILDGATKLESSAFRPVTENDSEYPRLLEEAKGRVYKCDLSEYGITTAGIMPDIKMWGLFDPFDVVSVNGEKLHSARYPNEGYESIAAAITPVTVGSVADRDTAEMKFIYRGTRPDRWITAENAWLSGFWAYGWAQDNVKLSSVDAALKTITTSGSSTYGLTSQFPGGRYYVYNLLEELDSEDEWYIDKNTDTLYLYSETGLENADIRIAADKKTLIKIENTSDIAIRNLTIENVKGCGINISGSKNISVKDCVLRNIAMDAVQITGMNCGVENCEIYNVDAGGINITGGNRSLLTNSGNYAVNNSIHDYALEYRVYRPGIRLSGVGGKAANNEIYNAPHSAVMYTGNEHIIEYNYIHDVVTETSDTGAVYCGQDFLGFGSVIRYNYFENIHTDSDIKYGYAVAVYLDDFYSGVQVYGNIMNNVDLGFLLGGGSCNTFENNIIMNAPNGAKTAILGDSRDSSYWESGMTEILARTDEIDYLNGIWQRKYPQTLNLKTDDPELPKYNTIKNNVIFKHGGYNIAENIKIYGTVEDYILISNDNIGFIDSENGNYKLRNDSMVFSVLPDFKNIPFEKIGRNK